MKNYKCHPVHTLIGAIQVLCHRHVTQIGVGGGVRFSGKKRYEGVRFNVISIMRGWVGGSNFQIKNVTLHLNGPIGKDDLTRRFTQAGC